MFTLGKFWQIGWRPGIGDPTVMGWLTVLFYLLVALACWFRSRITVSTSEMLLHRRFWQGLSIIVLLLGINKQLNFLTLFTSLGRTWAWQQQWWQERQSMQLGLLGLVVFLVVVLASISLWRFWHKGSRYVLATFGILLLCAFVLIRTTSLHAVDYYLYTPFAGIKLNWVFELGLLCLLLGTAVLPIGSLSERKQTSRQVS
ncbi:MAG: hypothetical protein HC804_14715 [Anaerolineae bacterium]|nr:hypothetical protein [Anaerolineae bacterium]